MFPIRLIVLTLPFISSEILLDISDFEGITKSWAFVDKTPLLRELLDGLEHQNLITCPRGFGKSINLNMLKRFAEIVVNSLGEPVDRKTTENYKLFTSYELNLAIAQDRDFINQHLGMYPVIYITFNDTTAQTYPKALQSIGKAIKRAFVEYKWLLDILDETQYYPEIEKFKTVINEGIKEEKEILKSLNVLSYLLNEHFQRTVLLLIDDYDAPIIRAIEEGPIANVQKLHQLIDKLYVSLAMKDAHIGRLLFSGVFTIARAEASSKLDNIITWPFLDEHKYTHYCGFTREQLHMLYDRFNVTYKNPLSHSQMRQIEKRYNSYNVKNLMTPIYNPYDTTHYLAKRKFDNYWIKHTSIYGHEAFTKVAPIKQKLLKLLWDKEVEFQQLTNVTAKDLEDHTKIGRGELTSVKTHHINIFFTYLLENGYLSYTSTDNIYQVPNSDAENELIVRYLS